MSLWEYRKIALNQLSAKVNDVDVLNDAGEEGWELAAILDNNVAYLKREIGDAISEAAEETQGQVTGGKDAQVNGDASSARSASEVKAKYRDPKTGETWSGRGRMATWLKGKQDAGEDVDDYLV